MSTSLMVWRHPNGHGHVTSHVTWPRLRSGHGHVITHPAQLHTTFTYTQHRIRSRDLPHSSYAISTTTYTAMQKVLEKVDYCMWADSDSVVGNSGVLMCMYGHDEVVWHDIR